MVEVSDLEDGDRVEIETTGDELSERVTGDVVESTQQLVTIENYVGDAYDLWTWPENPDEIHAVDGDATDLIEEISVGPTPPA